MNGSVGLDFGTSTTFVAVSDRRGTTRVLPLGRVGGSADLFLPSVARPDGGGFSVGEEPANLSGGVIRSVKRSITRDRRAVSTSGADPVQSEVDAVIGEILREAVRRAQVVEPGVLDGRPVRLGCPAMWDGDQRRRLATIAADSGLDVAVQEIVDEPIAAGVGWVTEERAQDRHVTGRVLVVDIGGGTLDIAFLDVVDDGRQPSFNVLAADAQDQAGDDIDDAIARELGEGLVTRGLDPAGRANPKGADAMLKQAARQLKVRLSTAASASVGVPPLLGVPELSYSRVALENLLRPMLRQAEGLARSVIASGRLRERNATTVQAIRADLVNVVSDVQYVLLTGGTSQIPLIRDYFTELFPAAKVVWTQSRSAQQAVAMGLAATDDYDRLNLHRPPFDLVAVAADGRETLLYAAYTPLYQAWQVQSGVNHLGHSASFSNDSSRRQTSQIVCRDLSGRRIPIVTIDGGRSRTATALHLDLPSWSQASIKLYVNGKLVLTSAGEQSSYRMESWPVLRSDDRGVPSPVVWQKEERVLHDAMTYRDSGEPG